MFYSDRSPRPSRLISNEQIEDLDPDLYIVMPRLAILYGLQDGTRGALSKIRL